MSENEEVLRAREEANRWLALAVAATATRLDKDAFKALVGVIEAAAVHLVSQGKPTAAEALRRDIGMLRAITQEGDLDPQLALAINALLYLEAGSHRRAALATWLETATELELSDEVRELLGRLSSSPPDGDA